LGNPGPGGWAWTTGSTDDSGGQVGARQGRFAEINAGKVELQGPLMREASPSKHGESGLDVSRS
jgi:hypothetical protein